MIHPNSLMSVRHSSFHQLQPRTAEVLFGVSKPIDGYEKRHHSYHCTGIVYTISRGKSNQLWRNSLMLLPETGNTVGKS
jgi:hypothetical protein